MFGKIRLPILAISTLLIAACSDNNSSDDQSVVTPAVTSDIPVDAQFSIQGIWEQSGYGDIIRVGENGADLFQYTRMSCLLAETYNTDTVADFYSNPEFSEDGDTLIPNVESLDAFVTTYERRDELPELCEPENILSDDSRTVTFDHLWHTFNDYYAFFNERNVDWNDQYSVLRPRVSDDLSDEAFLEIIADLLRPLNDGHVGLATENDGFAFVQPKGSELAIIEGFASQSEFDDIGNYEDALSDRYFEVLLSYLDDSSVKQDGGVDKDLVTWGIINEQVGYLQILEMSELAASDEEELKADLAAVDRIMPLVLSDLQDTDALIIDVRRNGGGTDAVSLAIANYFTDETRLVVSKRARSYLGESAELTASISPATQNPFLKPIVILSSPDTGSAAEVFLMAMKALAQVTLMGENSEGIFSDTLVKTLPNDWEVGLSNEVYTDSTGANFEVTGIPVDVPIEAFSIDALLQGADPVIDAALVTLGF